MKPVGYEITYPSGRKFTMPPWILELMVLTDDSTVAPVFSDPDSNQVYVLDPRAVIHDRATGELLFNGTGQLEG
jgi:hypothetical protein